MFNKKNSLTATEKSILDPIVESWRKESKNKKLLYYFYDEHCLFIIPGMAEIYKINETYQESPGLYLGRSGGELIRKYSNIIKREIPKIKYIKIKEVKIL